jgi:hypothetical protein
MFRLYAEQFNEEKRAEFAYLGQGGHYTSEQKAYAFQLIEEGGIRATAKILRMPRRTLQRWCRRYQVFVKRCPYWVYDWAERRRRRREFWQRRGYF